MGTATIFGFISVLCLMVLVTLLPYGVLPRAEIAEMRQPSMAAVLEAVVGHWGAIWVSLGLIISVLGAYLAWSLICAEVLYAPGTAFYIWARREQKKRVFNASERLIFILAVVSAIIAVIGLATGYIIL